MKTQLGRSMIEMLGVLAIIGVLSVGGLAGYTRAMKANRANNVLDFMNRCYVEVRSHGTGIGAYGPQPCGGSSAAAGELNEVYPSGLTSCSCERKSAGSVECLFQIDSSISSAFQAKTGFSATSGAFCNGNTWLEASACTPSE